MDQNHKNQKAREKPILLEGLGPRLKMSAKGMADDMDEPYLGEQALIEESSGVEIVHNQEEASAVNFQTREVVFVDTSVKDYEGLVNDLQKAAEDGHNQEIVLIDRKRDGISQITETLSKYNDLNAVHIYSHGSGGQIRLGDDWFDQITLSQNEEAVSAWCDVLSENAEMLIFGCGLASTVEGEQFVDALAQLTGADITASDVPTGSVTIGGDSELEYANGQVEEKTLIGQNTEIQFEGLVKPPTAANNTVTTNVDTTYTFTLEDFNYSYSDSVPMASVKITTLETVGALQLSGVDVILNQIITKADINAGNLKFVPVGNGNGTGYDSFDFSVYDGTTDSVAAYTITVDVAAVNDAPKFDRMSFTNNTIMNSADGAFLDNKEYVVDDDGLYLLSTLQNNDMVTWYENYGAEILTTKTSTTTDSVLSVITVDVDDDGDMDVLSESGIDNKFAWFEDYDSEDFTVHAIATSADNATSVPTADMDGDGDLEVMAGQYCDNKTVCYENDYSVNFTANTITSTADGAQSVSIADVGGDACLDVLSETGNDDNLTWYENDVSGKFTSHTLTTAVDGDGDMDVLSASVFDNTIALHENTMATALDRAPSCTEGEASIVLDSNVDISNSERDALNGGTGNYVGTSVTLVRNGGVNTDDVFSFRDGNGITLSGSNLIKNTQIIATFDTTTIPGQVVVTFTDANGEIPTLANVDNILRQITYANSFDDTPASFQIEWKVDDGTVDTMLNNLVYNTTNNDTGTTTRTVTLTSVTDSSSGLTADGMVATVNVAAVNDAPTAANNTVTTTEDTTYTFTASDFNYSDVEGDTMASVRVTTLETVGSLQVSGVDVTLNQVITNVDIDAGNLKFVPLADANGIGYDNFNFSVNNGTTDSVSTYTMTVDVTPVVGIPTIDSQITADTTPTIIGTYDSGNSVELEVFVDGTLYILSTSPELTSVGDNWTLNITVPLTNGTYEVVTTSIDGLGNQTTGDAANNYITIDTTAPTIDTQMTNEVVETVTDVSEKSTSDTGTSELIVNTTSPVVESESFTIAEGDIDNECNLDVGTTPLDRDTDSGGDALTVNTAPVSGSVFASSFALNSDGGFSYTHDGSMNFSDSFTYEVKDKAGNTDIVAVTIKITPKKN